MKSVVEAFFSMKVTVPIRLMRPLLEEFSSFSMDEKKFECTFIKTTSCCALEDTTEGRILTAEITLTVPLFDKDRLQANIKMLCEKEGCKYISDNL